MPRTRTERRYASVPDAAEYAGVVPRTIRRMIARGELDAYRFGARLIRVDLNQVDELMRPVPSAGEQAS